MKKLILIIMLLNVFSIKTKAIDQKIVIDRPVEQAKVVIYKIKDFKDNYKLVSTQFLVDAKDYTIDLVIENEQDLTITFETDLKKVGVPFNLKLTLNVVALKSGVLKNQLDVTVDNETVSTFLEIQSAKIETPIETPKFDTPKFETPTETPKQLEAYKWTYKCPNLCESFVEAGTKEIQNLAIAIFVILGILVFLKTRKE